MSHLATRQEKHCCIHFCYNAYWLNVKTTKKRIDNKLAPHIVTYPRNLEYLQKVIICYLSHYPYFLKVSLEFIRNYQVMRPTVKQTNRQINEAMRACSQ